MMFPTEAGEVWLPREAAAQLLSISEQTLYTWQREADPPPYNDERRAYSARALGEWIRMKQTIRPGVGKRYPYKPDELILKPTMSGIPSAVAGPEKKNYNDERTRKEAAAADKIEMENAITRGEYVHAQDVETAWSSILSRVKTRIMQLPYTCAMLVVGDNDMASVQAKIKSATNDALLELSTDWREQKDEEE